MLGFVQNLFAPKGNPIGVDFGTDALRLAQVHLVNGEYQLLAAASADVPNHVRQDLGLRLNWFVDTTRDLLSQGRFRGRQAVLGLPAAAMHIQHLRMPKMDSEALKKALPWEVRGKIPVDPSQALLRHLVAGEIYQEQEQKLEVIALAASRDLINQFLAAAARARLDVVGMNIEPQVVADCFAHLYHRRTDVEVTNCFVDIGSNGARAIVARGHQIYFSRGIPIGGDHFSRAVAAKLRLSFEDAKLLRIKLCHATPVFEEPREKSKTALAVTSPVEVTEEQSFALLGAALAKHKVVEEHKDVEEPRPIPRAVAVLDGPVPDPALLMQAQEVEEACRPELDKLVEELDLCRRYYEATFPSRPIERLVFIGGEARQRALCQYIARSLSLAAQVGDPLVRMAREAEVGAESGLDRRQPQPAWVVAVGLSMGPAATPAGR